MAAVATETPPFHVLAVDDSLPDRKLIERLLKTSSFQVTTVDSGSKALEFLGIHDDPVSLIITDYCMPGMTGYDLLKKIKQSDGNIDESSSNPTNSSSSSSSSDNSNSRKRKVEGDEEILPKANRSRHS
ncbi:hypothetical protein HU200_030792 [Digitaria exilis]|uniref:Response regulatory domain-containing protein n=1 Tax=Digitaria exilis TaxID=1010633 RepID=A0A835BRC2_9POAL|nr:hypothetical protein HU200_030792 [Digitaria exilis]